MRSQQYFSPERREYSANKEALHQKITRQKPTYISVYGVEQRCHCIGLEFSKLWIWHQLEFVQAWERLRIQPNMWWAPNVKKHLDTEMLDVLSEFDKLLNQEQRLHQTQEESLWTMNCGVRLFIIQLQLLKSWMCKFMGNLQLCLNFTFSKHFIGSNPRIFFAPILFGRGLGTVW